MSKIVDLDGNEIEQAPHFAGVVEILRRTADNLERADFYKSKADRVLVIVGFEDGAQCLSFNRELTLEGTLWMLERERADLLDRARNKD